MSNCPGCETSTRDTLLEQLGGRCPRCVAGFVMTDEEEIPLSPGLEDPSAIDEDAPLKLGTRFRGMEVLAFLGRGGMGFVYKARQPDLDRIVALKILSPQLAGEANFADRFHAEARAMAALNHPNIVQVYEVGREGDLYFLVMEYVEGSSLRTRFNEVRATPTEALRLLQQICAGLEYAHAEGVVHRDIKPENILLDARGRLKLADFGLAKIMGGASDRHSLTRSSVVMGSPQYMAPEQYEGMKGVDHRADIYSFGVIAYEMLTGEVPMGSFDPPSTRAGVDGRFDPLVLKALNRRPESRFQQVSEIIRLLEGIVVAAPARTWRFRIVPLAVTVVALVAILIALDLFARDDAITPIPLDDGFVPILLKGHGAEATVSPEAGSPAPRVIPEAPDLATRFTLRFQARYEVEAGQEPWIWVILASRESGDNEGAHAVFLFPEGREKREVVFASWISGKGWGMRENSTLPAGIPASGAWSEFEVQWDDSTKQLRVSVDGRVCFDQRLEDAVTLHGPWRFEIGGAAKEVRLKGVGLKNEVRRPVKGYSTADQLALMSGPVGKLRGTAPSKLTCWTPNTGASVAVPKSRR